MGPARTLGVDVARFGADETCLVSLDGRRAKISGVYQGKDTNWTVGEIRRLHEDHPYDRIAVDDVGVGGGVVDALRAADLPVIPVNFGNREGLRDPVHYINMKAEIYFGLRKEFEAGWREPDNPEVGLSIPNDGRLQSQLANIEYEFDERQRYRIVKRQHAGASADLDLTPSAGRSPDRADALALAVWVRRRSSLLPAIMQANLDARQAGIGATIKSMDF
jgi:hypothetical protein